VKLSILEHMDPGIFYFREELARFSKRIDFELSYLLDSGEIIKHYQGIYSLAGSYAGDQSLIDKIMARDRSSLHLIIPLKSLKRCPAGLSINDYICLNQKRSDLISTGNFKVKFQIPTHGFPKRLTDSFLIIYQLNTSLNPESALDGLSLTINQLGPSFIKDLKKYANKKTYKIIIERIKKESELRKISSELSHIGAPIIIDSRQTMNSKKSSKEKIIADALLIGMKEPRIHNILPFTILKNASSLDFKMLQDLTKENGTYRYAGFILELLRRAGFQDVPEFKAPKYSKTPSILFRNTYGKRGLERLKTSHLDFALVKWGILVDSHVDSERDKIRKWL